MSFEPLVLILFPHEDLTFWQLLELRKLDPRSTLRDGMLSLSKVIVDLSRQVVGLTLLLQALPTYVHQLIDRR